MTLVELSGALDGALAEAATHRAAAKQAERKANGIRLQIAGLLGIGAAPRRRGLARERRVPELRAADVLGALVKLGHAASSADVTAELGASRTAGVNQRLVFLWRTGKVTRVSRGRYTAIAAPEPSHA